MGEAVDVDAIEARANAAIPGPWQWFGNTDAHDIYLATTHSGRRFVMQFARFGMNGAQPVFQDHDRHLMVKASELVRFQVAPDATSRKDSRVYRADVVGTRHPDAEFIAHAREDIPALIARIRELETEICTPRALATLTESELAAEARRRHEAVQEVQAEMKRRAQG